MAGLDTKIKFEADKEITVTNGRTRFESTDLSRQPEVTPKQQENEALARSPEEIRRKLKARNYKNSGGKASFTAKDL